LTRPRECEDGNAWRVTERSHGALATLAETRD
jgi:hypothetical protein